jgi:hypothetical protein
MKNKLLAQGKMFRLSTTVITKVELKELMKTGRAGELYESLETTRNNENNLYGFYQVEGKPSFEIKLNEAPMDLKKTLSTEYERTYLPILGSSKKKTGTEEFFYVSESGFKKGNSELEFDRDFEPKDLKFQYKRFGLFNGTIFTIINPTYKDQYFNYIWNWSSFSSDYIISTKGKLHQFPSKT